MVSVDPEHSYDRSTRDAGALASCWFSLLLAVEVASTGRAPADRHGLTHADPADERRESALGAPRIHGELLKLGFEVAQSSVAKYMVRRRRPPGQGWRTCVIMRQISRRWIYLSSQLSGSTCSTPSLLFG